MERATDATTPPGGPRAAGGSRAVGSAQRAQVEAWMRALAAGDRAAFTPLFDALWPVVHRVSLRMLANPADADDAAQDALIKLAARVGEYDPARGDAVAWVIGIAVYECRTWRQRRRRREERLDALGGEQGAAAGPGGAGVDERGAGDDPEALAVARDLHAALGEVLGQLAPGDLEVITAALREERAAADGVSGATFRKRLQRALRRLRDAWRASYGDE